MKRSSLIDNGQRAVIITPALRADNNGNWQTARRWQRFLAPLLPTRLTQCWPDAQAADDTLMIALHARRSAEAVAAWHARHGDARLAVVLTGTDLYRDIDQDAAAKRSLALAHSLVVLQERGLQALPASVRGKARIIFQSTASRQTLAKSSHRLRAVMVGHLREEKSPVTLFAAARRLADQRDIFIDHIGAALDPVLARQAEETMAMCSNYRWLGGRPHEEVRRRIQRAHVLIHASRMEGGAHVVMEAIASGTPVLASHIEGNIGMLGTDYAGYFPWNNESALAALLVACRASQSRAGGTYRLLEQLAAQCTRRAPLFAPATEQAAVRQLVSELLGGR
jgi:putative glycosyltransferase (TIGR04348 family)